MDLQLRPRRAFAELARRLRAGEAPPLDEAALALAAELEPELDRAGALATLDDLARRAAGRVSGLPEGEPRVAALVAFLHDVEGFRGDPEDYDDPRNSFLDQVLARRRGIPIGLAVVYEAVARRLGLRLEGIGFPGHFLLRWRGGRDLLVDPFFGRLLDDRECAERLKRALGPEARFERDALRVATLAEILIRTLGNLKRSYVGSGDLVLAATCCDRILLLVPDLPGELRDRGLLYEKLDCPGAARADLERFLALAPEDPTADAVRRRLDAMRRAPATLH